MEFDVGRFVVFLIVVACVVVSFRMNESVRWKPHAVTFLIGATIVICVASLFLGIEI